MNDLLLLWLSLSLSGSLVAVTLILLKPLLQRFSKTWQYYLWLLVILRFLIPFSPEVSIVGGLFQKVETHLNVQREPIGQVPEFHFPEGTQSLELSDIGNSNSQELPMAFDGFF